MSKQLFIGFTVVLITLFLSLSGFATAAESDYLYDPDAIITGMVEQEEGTIILKTIDGDQYTITGADLSDMVGKKVRATGELVRDNKENMFNVNEVVEAKEHEMMLDRWLPKPLPLESGQD